MGHIDMNDEFGKISNYLDKLHFKKSLYGASLEDVYACMKELDGMYREVLQDYKESLDEEMKERQRRIENRENQLQDKMEQLKDMQKGRKEEQERIVYLEKLLKEEEKRQEDYKEKTALLAENLIDTQKNKAFVLEQANREARGILYEANREAEKIIKNSRIAAEEEEEKSKTVLEEITKLRSNAYENLKLIQSDLQSMSNDVVKLQDKIEGVPDHIEPVKVEIGHTRNTEVSEITRIGSV